MSHRKPCGKRVIKRRITAARILARMPVKEGRDETRAYFCRRCNGWHLTSQLL